MDARTNLTEFSELLKAAYAHVEALQVEAVHLPIDRRYVLEESLLDLMIGFEELQVAEEESFSQSEEVLSAEREEAHHFRDLFEAAPDGYIVTDAKGLILRANRAAADLLKLPPGHANQEPLAAFVHKDDRADFRARLVRLDQAHRAQQWELRLTPPAGGLFYVSLSVAVTHNAQGNPVLVRWLIRDISKRKQTEDSLRAARDELEALVQERTAALMEANARLEAEIVERERIEQERADLLRREQEARAEAEKANQLKVKFLATISHELRTPLASIVGFASTLLAEDVTFDEKTSREFVGIIEDEAEKLTELIEQLLDVSRIEAGTMGMMREYQPFEMILNKAMAEFKTLTTEHVLTIQMPDDLPFVFIDPRRVAQVLANLVTNAVKHAPPHTEIAIRVNTVDEGIQVDVVDHGPGIAPQYHQVVFEAFRQIEDEKFAKKGVGLGLAICKGIIEAHGGRIWISSRAGTGTTISFILPATSSPV
jgi:PAS domain S-box-containing protein